MHWYLELDQNRGEQGSEESSQAPQTVKGTDYFLSSFLLQGQGLCINGNIRDPHAEGENGNGNHQVVQSINCADEVKADHHDHV